MSDTIGPKVPKEIQDTRDLRLGRAVHTKPLDIKTDQKPKELVKIKQFFDTGKSLNDEVKNEMMKNMKGNSNRFEE